MPGPTHTSEDNSLFRPPVSAGVALTPPLSNFGERLRVVDLLIAKAPEDCAASRIAVAALAEARTPALAPPVASCCELGSAIALAEPVLGRPATCAPVTAAVSQVLARRGRDKR